MTADTYPPTGTGLLDAPQGTPWHRSPRTALGLLVASTLLAVMIGALGESVMTLALPRRGSLLPPFSLPGRNPIPSWGVAFLGWGTVLVGALGTWVSWRALDAGWRPDNRKLFGLGALMTVSVALVPPMTSADVIMYAAYGRLSELGFDNYTVTPAEVLRTQFDPVLVAMEEPWQDTVSVYGPLLWAVMRLANALGGTNVHDIVFWFQLIFTTTFLAAGAVTVRVAGGERLLQSRAILMTVACPLMIWGVVAGAHNESLGLCLAVAGFLFLRSNPFLAGLLIGTGMTSKATVGVYGLAMAWAYRRRLKAFLLAGLGGAIPNVIAYLLVFPAALETASKNASYVAATSWAFPIQRFLSPFLPEATVSSVLGVLPWLLALVVGWMLARVLPWRAAPGLPEGADLRRDPVTVAVRAAVVISGAWLLTSAYTLPWYDLMCFMPMALLGPTRLDLIELVRVTALNLGYVLGRYAPMMTPAMELASRRSRELTSNVAVVLMLAVVVWWQEHALRRRAAPPPKEAAADPSAG
ncbi:hypothetical protein GCM10027418_31210 [Mariniluteicoccus endophyticus]